jgi:hypothetical protein
MLPVPLAGMPMAGLSLVQDIMLIPPVVDTVKFTGGIAAPLHTVWLLTGVIVGVGLTVMVNVVGVPVQVVEAALYVIVILPSPVFAPGVLD